MTDQTTDRVPMSDERFARLGLLAEVMWRNGQGPFSSRDVAFVMAQIALDTLEPEDAPTLTEAQVRQLVEYALIGARPPMEEALGRRPRGYDRADAIAEGIDHGIRRGLRELRLIAEEVS